MSLIQRLSFPRRPRSPGSPRYTAFSPVSYFVPDSPQYVPGSTDDVADPPVCKAESRMYLSPRATHRAQAADPTAMRSQASHANQSVQRRRQFDERRRRTTATVPSLGDPSFLIFVELRAHIAAVEAMQIHPELQASAISALDRFLSSIEVPFPADDVDPDDPHAVLKFAKSITY